MQSGSPGRVAAGSGASAVAFLAKQKAEGTASPADDDVAATVDVSKFTDPTDLAEADAVLAKLEEWKEARKKSVLELEKRLEASMEGEHSLPARTARALQPALQASAAEIESRMRDIMLSLGTKPSVQDVGRVSASEERLERLRSGATVEAVEASTDKLRARELAASRLRELGINLADLSVETDDDRAFRESEHSASSASSSNHRSNG
jgi:hypothetical protein